MEDDDADKDYVDINGEFVRILQVDSYHRYLGRLLSLSYEKRTFTEFDHRKKQAWKVFYKHKKVLFNAHVSLRRRLYFFDVCVTPVILFSLSVLPVSKSKIKELDRLQRKMLRRIIGWRRTPNEDWHDTMKRMNDRLENAQSLYYCEDWSSKYAKNLWKYAYHVACLGSEQWARVLTLESRKIRQDTDAIFAPFRSPGRPKLRLDDEFASFFRT